jgi:hypothetical protein
MCRSAPVCPSGWWIGSAQALRDRRHITHSVENDVYDVCGRGYQWRVVDRACANGALIRSAVQSWVSGLIMRSSSATKTQLGLSFHRGPLDRAADDGASREPVPVAWVGAFRAGR